MTIRVLIVDDSATMRAILLSRLCAEPGIEVLGSASDASQAREMIKRLNPDVITLDIEMPGMNGLDFLEKIMTLRPMPVIIVSGATQEGNDVSARALALGAVDCYSKYDPSGKLALQDSGQLAKMIRAAAQVNFRKNSAVAPSLAGEGRLAVRRDTRLIAIGSSTGGVEALQVLLRGFPRDCPPTVIVQHVNTRFAPAIARTLDALCPATVQVAEDARPLQVGNVISTVLGSCVATCLYDPVVELGGMNHFLLPEPPASHDRGEVDIHYGVYLMEMLINEMLAYGARKDRLRAHLYGGANIRAGMQAIGTANAEFARGFLLRERIELVREDMGGNGARRVDFRPSSGMVRCRTVAASDAPEAKGQPIVRPAPRGEVELF